MERAQAFLLAAPFDQFLENADGFVERQSGLQQGRELPGDEGQGLRRHAAAEQLGEIDVRKRQGTDLFDAQRHLALGMQLIDHRGLARGLEPAVDRR